MSILRKPKPTARLAHYGHDLSLRTAFTSSVGHLIPVLYDFLDGGTKVSINDFLFTRTQPLKTCALVRVSEYIDYFFVPMRSIDGYWENAYFGIDDFHDSNALLSNSAQQAITPYSVPVSDIAYGLGQFASAFYGYTTLSSSSINMYELVSAETNSARFILKVDTNRRCLDAYGIPLHWNSLRLLHALGYSTEIANVVGGSLGQVGTIDNLHLNLNLLYVYQKIWYDYYRLSQWTPNSPDTFNKNSAMKSTVSFANQPQSIFWDNRYQSIFTLRYRPIKKDFFTNIEPSPLFNSSQVNAYPYTGKPELNDLNSYLLSAYGVQLQGVPPSISTRAGSNIQPDDNGAMPYAANNLQNLRLAYAYERLMSVTQRAGRHVDDQYRAHLGVSLPAGSSGEVYFLGSHRSELMIGEVVATAAGQDGSSTSSLGEIAGRGLGASNRKRNKTIKFKAPCSGYLMALYSALPDIDYKYTGINKLNLYGSIMDYPRPEFDNLGMQPLFGVQSYVVAPNYSTCLSEGKTFVTPSLCVGWQYRYSELKLSYDRVFGGLLETLSDWSANIIFGQGTGVEAALYCNPCYLDNIFALSFRPPFTRDIPEFAQEDLPLTQSSMYIELSSVTPQANPITGDVTSVSGDSCHLLRAGTTASYIWDNSVMYSRDPLIHTIDFKYRKSSYLSTYSMPL